MDSKRVFLGLDVGAKRVGVALGNSIARIAQPLTTIVVDGRETEQFQQLIREHDVTDIVVGRPRNQAGDTTPQTILVEQFVARTLPNQAVQWQDESVTSVMAEERLAARNKPYQKSDIDAEAAAIILQDYLEAL